MTYATEKGKLGQEPFEFIDIEADYCAETIGEGNCTANIDVTGNVVRAMSDRVYLDASASGTSDAYNSTHQLAITAGTGSGQSERVTDYVVESVTNSVLYSEQFDNPSWAVSGSTVTPNTYLAPNGTLTADLAIITSTAGGFGQQISLSSRYFSTKIFVERYDTDWMFLTARDPATEYVDRSLVWVNLALGTIGTVTNKGAASLVSSEIAVNGTMLEVDLVFDLGSTISTIGFGGAQAVIGDGLTTRVVGGGCYLWGAMVNGTGVVIPEYVPTTSAPATETVRVAYVANDLTTIPDATSDYALIDRASACYNTRATCLDVPNYNKTTKSYKICEPRGNIPLGQGFLPFLISKPATATATVTGGKGLGDRAIISATLSDAPHHDRGIDPYIASRTYKDTAMDRGTFWGKWLRRNPYYETRALTHYVGYLGDSFSLDNFIAYRYDITDIDGPSGRKFKITAKDFMIRTYEQKAQWPAANTGVLLSDITSGATSATLTPTGIGDSEYPASGTISIGSEAMTFTRSSDTITLANRGSWGTSAAAHSAGDVLQVSKVYSDINVVDALNEILTTGAGIPSTYIPYGTGSLNWDDEKSLWLSSATITAVVMKPEPVRRIIEEWCQVFLFDVWWDASAQEIMIKALSPEPSGETPATLTEDYEILEDSLSIKRDAKSRFTQIRAWHSRVDASKSNDPENFSKLQIALDAIRSGADLYNSSSIKTIISRWFDSEARAAQLTGRMLARFSDTPEVINFAIHAKDSSSVSLAKRVTVQSWQMQDFTGATESRTYQVTKIANDTRDKNKIMVTAITSSFSGRYAFIAPAGLPDYSSATEEQKKKYAFICQASGFFSDGEPAYKII